MTVNWRAMMHPDELARVDFLAHRAAELARQVTDLRLERKRLENRGRNRVLIGYKGLRRAK